MRRNEGGQATLELALCLPFVALLLAIIVQVGMIAADGTRLWHGAREAARAAAVDGDPARISAAAAAGGLEGIEVKIEPAEPERIQGEPVTVDLAYSPAGRTPLVGRLFDDIRLTASASMRIEDP